MKHKLVTLDRKRTGRVPLAKFYGKSLKDDEWRFGESESYLRAWIGMGGWGWPGSLFFGTRLVGFASFILQGRKPERTM